MTTTATLTRPTAAVTGQTPEAAAAEVAEEPTRTERLRQLRETLTETISFDWYGDHCWVDVDDFFNELPTETQARVKAEHGPPSKWKVDTPWDLQHFVSTWNDEEAKELAEYRQHGECECANSAYEDFVHYVDDRLDALNYGNDAVWGYYDHDCRDLTDDLSMEKFREVYDRETARRDNFNRITVTIDRYAGEVEVSYEGTCITAYVVVTAEQREFLELWEGLEGVYPAAEVHRVPPHTYAFYLTLHENSTTVELSPEQVAKFAIRVSWVKPENLQVYHLAFEELREITGWVDDLDETSVAAAIQLLTEFDGTIGLDDLAGVSVALAS